MWSRSAALLRGRGQAMGKAVCEFPLISTKSESKNKGCLLHVANMSSNSKSSSGVHEGKVGVNGVDLFYEQVGTGSIPLLLMPGALGSIQTDFRPQLEQLNRDLFTIVAFDPRGYGKSRPPARDFSNHFLRQDARDARELMKVLGHEKFCPLGWSDGAISALILAGTHPAAVDKLVIWGCNAIVTKADTKMYNSIRDVSKWSEQMRAPMEAVYGAEYFAQLWSDWCDGILRLRQSEGDAYLMEKKDVSCPTLIVHGDQDVWIPPGHPEILADAIQGSKLVKWPKGKHNLHLNYPEKFNQLVEEFIMTGSNSSKSKY